MSIKVIGTPTLARKLKELADQVTVSAAAKAVNRAAGEACADVIRRHAPNTGISRQKGWPSIRDTIKVSQKGMPAYVRQDRANPAGLWLEHGTVTREHESGKGTGAVRATHWWSIGRNKSRAAVRRVLRKGYQEIVEGIARGG